MGRNPRVRAIRIAALVLVLLAGVAFHDSGRTYQTLRDIYLVVIVGLLAYSLSARRRGLAGRPGNGAPFGARVGRGFGSPGWGGGPSAGPAPGQTIDVPIAKPEEPPSPPA